LILDLVLVKSLKGFNLNNPGFQPGDRKVSKSTVRAEAGIEKQQWLRTELRLTKIEK